MANSENVLEKLLRDPRKMLSETSLKSVITKNISLTAVFF